MVLLTSSMLNLGFRMTSDLAACAHAVPAERIVMLMCIAQFNPTLLAPFRSTHARDQHPNRGAANPSKTRHDPHHEPSSGHMPWTLPLRARVEAWTQRQSAATCWCAMCGEERASTGFSPIARSLLGTRSARENVQRRQWSMGEAVDALGWRPGG